MNGDHTAIATRRRLPNLAGNWIILLIGALLLAGALLGASLSPAASQAPHSLVRLIAGTDNTPGPSTKPHSTTSVVAQSLHSRRHDAPWYPCPGSDPWDAPLNSDIRFVDLLPAQQQALVNLAADEANAGCVVFELT